MKLRVAVTGLGVICGAADSLQTFASALKHGKRGFSKLTDPRAAHLKADHAALVDVVSLSPEDECFVGNMDRFVRLALFALRQAVVDAGLVTPLGPRAAIVLGTCSGGMRSTELQIENRLRGIETLSALDYFSARYYSGAKVLANVVGASGPTATVVTACAAGTGAAAHGVDLIRTGLCDIALVGGSDSFALSTLVGFDALKAVCEGMCSPFSENIGLNLGEGSGFLVLERLDWAKERGASVIGEILGSGLSNDAYHATSPDPSGKGQTAAMTRALANAGIGADRVDYVNAHGTGTRANDAVESRAVARILNERSAAVPVSSTKSMIGHCLGAAGALEAAAVLIAAQAGTIPPTAGFTVPREGCSLDYVSDCNRPFNGSIVLSNSFGFGGSNACLVLDTKPNLHRSDPPQLNRLRPVITGWGAIHPLGCERMGMLNETKLGIAEMTRLPMATAKQVALVPEVDARTIDRRLDFKNMDLCSKYLTAAARLALEHAQIPMRPNVTAEIGMVVGASFGPGAAEAAHVEGVLENRYRLDRVDAFPYVVQNETAGHAARALLLKGHNTVFSTGWGAGLAALTGGAAALQCGHGDTLIAAAADEVTERFFRDAQAANIYGSSASVVMGEGAAAVVLESREAAERRNASIFGEILGYGAATDITGDVLECITSDSAIAALSQALDRAGRCGREVRWAAYSYENGPLSHLEGEAVRKVCPAAQPVTAALGLGFSEAALCLIQLNRALQLASEGDVIAALSISREGLAYAVVVERR